MFDDILILNQSEPNHFLRKNIQNKNLSSTAVNIFSMHVENKRKIEQRRNEKIHENNLLKGKFLIDLLPYDFDVKIFDNILKSRILSLILVILNELIESINNFYFKKNLSLFDPHVGENLCQIRACQLLDIHFEANNIPEIKNNLLMEINNFEHMVIYVNKLLDKNIYKSEITRSSTVQTFLDEFQLNIPISNTLYYLTISHFLTKFSGFNALENTIIDYSKLLSELKISKNIGRRIIHQYQKQISFYSYNYVENKALLHNKMNINLLKMLQQFDDDGRYTLPCYIVMEILLENLRERKNNILFVVRHEKNIENKFTTLLYVYNEMANCYFYCTNPTDDILNEPCFVIHGVHDDFCGTKDNYIAEFNEFGINQIIMGNMAAHPQYSGKKLTTLKNNPFIPIVANANNLSEEVMLIEKQFSIMKDTGEEAGCSVSNAKLFYIKHIFCNTLDRELQRIKNKCFYSTKTISLVPS